ncbi:response regulator [uncultured Shimia sp.]|uniref:response regulator n=1 Tax=uncultured Shimia sp. TaxID=573152 RepID=UPI0025DC9415|nr:response regulator [uncultured Shimia sp.]
MPLTNSLWTLARSLAGRSYLPSFIALAVVVCFAVYVERNQTFITKQEQRTLAISETSRLRAQIEGYVNADIQLVRGMIAALSANLDMSQEEYSTLASQVMGTHQEFLNIALAPDLVVTRVYPYEPNKAALGLDYNQNEAQRAAAYRVRDSGKMVLAGPVNLVQGGTGFIGRFPVWDTRNGQRRFWGVVAAVIDADGLYQQAGLLDGSLTVDVALIGKDGTGAEGDLFFGDPAVLDDSPILMDIQLPSGTWQMAARPQNGWAKTASDVWGTRIFFMFIGLLIFIPTFAAGRLSDTRRSAIDALKRRETELERLSLVAKHASDSIILSTPSGEIQWVNAGFTRMTGYSSEEAVGQHVGALLNSENTNPETIQEMINQRIQGNRFHCQIVNRTKDGRDIWVGTNIFPIKDDDGNITMNIGIERDITRTKQYEKELAEAKLVAEKADRAKTDFLANMSHEIRTPMNGILGMADLLAESGISGEDRQCVDTIRDSGHALLKIINDILDLSRLESGKLEVSEVNFNLRHCIDSAVELLRHKATQKGISLTVDYEDDLPTEVRADNGRLRQIIVNLVGNAVKFTSEGGVRVLVKRDEASEYGIKVEVFDTGIGITEAQAEHIFDRFSQADAATTRAFGGTGLGLTISAMLARRMGGDIALCTEYDEGACFVATIDAKPAVGRPKKEAEAPTFASEHLEGARILLAEDNKTNRLLVQKYLAAFDVELIEVENGLQAVEFCKAYTPDVVLMDMSMPELDGVEATRIIRSLPIPQPPIVALTANAFESDRDMCLEAGMDFFLSKPINKAHLLQALSTQLEHRKAS